MTDNEDLCQKCFTPSFAAIGCFRNSDSIHCKYTKMLHPTSKSPQPKNVN